VTAVLAVTLAAVGAVTVYATWRRAPERDPVLALSPPVREAFAGGFRLDGLYDRVFVRPVRALAREVVSVDDNVVDAAVRGSGGGARRLGGVLRRTESGNVQGYLTGALTGFVLVAVAVLVVVGA
jgi:NADH-quinone oxidoreductase subunit L